MTTHDLGLRKAAILIDTLDQVGADALLERLTDESADRIRRELLGLESVEPAERRRILDELGGCSPSTGHEDETDVIENETSESQVSHRRSRDAQHRCEKTVDDVKRDRQSAKQIPELIDNSITATDPTCTLSEAEPFAFLNNTPTQSAMAKLGPVRLDLR